VDEIAVPFDQYQGMVLARPVARSPVLRKALLTAHIGTSVGWLGVAMSLFALACTGRLSSDLAMRRAVYEVMLLLANAVAVPLSLSALATGILLALVTPWRLVMHWWVLVKLALTVLAAALTFFALRSSIGSARHAARAADLGQLRSAGISLIGATTVSVSLYAFITAISVYKPWGRTGWGRRSLPKGPLRSS
jgi:hypothetical protein